MCAGFDDSDNTWELGSELDADCELLYAIHRSLQLEKKPAVKRKVNAILI